MSDKNDAVNAVIQSKIDLQIDLIRNVVNSSAPSLFKCEECGDDIPDKRREAVPGVYRCIGCQRNKEIVKRR